MEEASTDATEAPKSGGPPKKIKKITVPLATPIQWGEETITELVLHRPTFKDMQGMSEDMTMKDMMVMAQRCARVPRKIIEELDGEDAMEVVEALGDFLDSGQKTRRIRSF